MSKSELKAQLDAFATTASYVGAPGTRRAEGSNRGTVLCVCTETAALLFFSLSPSLPLPCAVLGRAPSLCPCLCGCFRNCRLSVDLTLRGDGAGAKTLVSQWRSSPPLSRSLCSSLLCTAPLWRCTAQLPCVLRCFVLLLLAQLWQARGPPPLLPTSSPAKKKKAALSHTRSPPLRLRADKSCRSRRWRPTRGTAVRPPKSAFARRRQRYGALHLLGPPRCGRRS